MLRTAFTTVNTRVVLASSSRAFHATPLAAKTITEKAAETADKVNKSVGKGLASAIEKGEEVTQSTKETLGAATENTKQTAAQAGQKANQAAAGAREGTQDFKHDVKKQVK